MDVNIVNCPKLDVSIFFLADSMSSASLLSPKAEIWGGSVAGMIQGLEAFGAAPEVIDRLWTNQGLMALSENEWYPVRAYLAFLGGVGQAFGGVALQAMGRAIPGSSKFPPDMDSLLRALQMLDVAYQVNHRGGVIGRYRCTELGPGNAVMVCENPYPCDLDRGILERLVSQFGPEGVEGTVTHLGAKGCRKDGALACHFEVRWWHAES